MRYEVKRLAIMHEKAVKFLRMFKQIGEAQNRFPTRDSIELILPEDGAPRVDTSKPPSPKERRSPRVADVPSTTKLSEQEVELFRKLKQQYDQTVRYLYAVFQYRDQLHSRTEAKRLIARSPITEELDARNPSKNTKKFIDM